MMNKTKRKTGKTSLEIKFLVYQRWGTITAAARELNYSRSQLSYCILRKRLSPEIKEKLAQALDIPVEELFGGSDDDETTEQDSASTPGDETTEQDSASTPSDETAGESGPVRKKGDRKKGDLL